MHYHNCMEIGLCYKGSGVFFVGNQIIPFSKGDVSIIFKNQAHIAKSNSSDPSLWHFVMIDTNCLLSNISNRHIAKLRSWDQIPIDFPHILNSKEHLDIWQLSQMIINQLAKKSANY